MSAPGRPIPRKPVQSDYADLSSRSFAKACFDVDIENWRRAQKQPPQHHEPRAAAPTTLEALMFQLRAGPGALKDASAMRRLAELSPAQVKEACGRLLRFRPQIARPWIAGEVTMLPKIWRRSRGQ